MAKEIFIPVETKQEIMATFRTSKPTLWAALTFKTRSPFSRALRAAAIQRGGVIYTGKVPVGFTPGCSTNFDHAKGIIVQEFGENARIIIDKTKNQASIEIQNQAPVVIRNMTVDKWEALLYQVQMIVNDLQ